MAFGKTGIDWRSTTAAIWRSNRHFLKPISQVNLVDPDSLIGIEDQKALLYKNTENFLRGKPCSHALLWGGRGVGKSSLVKTLLTRYQSYGLRIIQMPREDIHLLAQITDDIHDHKHHFIIYCDDLLLAENHREYRVLKGIMEGTLEKPPTNILVYATTNQQQLMPGEMTDNLNVNYSVDSENPAEALSECLSLADHFGLSLSFDPMTEETYLAIVDNLFKRINVDNEQLHEEAISFAKQRGGFGGRTARHFLNHYQIYL